MVLQDSILKAFADSVNKSESSASDSRTVYGTVARKDSTGVYVRLNGADESSETPVVSMVEVGVGDVVMITMKNHTATIIGNISWPATTRVGALYVTMTADGLMVGQLDPDTNLPVGYYMLITDSNIQLRQIINTPPGYKVLASFGQTITLGPSNAMHSIVDSEGLKVYNNTTLIAKFGTTTQIGPNNSTHTVINANSMTVYNSSGTALIKIGVTQSLDAYGTNVTGLYTIGSVYSEGGKISVGNASKKTKLDMIAAVDSSGKGGSVGLRANNSDWLIRRNNQTGQIYLGGKDLSKFMYITDYIGSQLWSGSLNPPAGGFDGMQPGDYDDSDGYRCRPISDIANWYVIGLRVKSGDEWTSILFFRSSGDISCYLSDPAYSYNGDSVVVKTAYRVHWSAASVGLRRITGPDVASCYGIVGVYGVVPIPGTRTTESEGGAITPID